MSTYRIYVDSRERKDGTATHFEYALPYTLSIRERSLAMIDVVVVPNSIKTISKGKNSMIYVKEIATVGGTFEVRLRYLGLTKNRREATPRSGPSPCPCNGGVSPQLCGCCSAVSHV